MSYEEKIKFKIKKLIEEKTTEIQRNNIAKVEAIRIKLRKMLEIENLLSIMLPIMNEELSAHNKMLRTQGNTKDLLDKIDSLDPNDPEMKIPHEDLRIGLGFVSAKSPNSKGFARAVIELPFGADKVSAKLDDKVVWNYDINNLSNDMIEELVLKMIEDAKW